VRIAGAIGRGIALGSAIGALFSRGVMNDPDVALADPAGGNIRQSACPA